MNTAVNTPAGDPVSGTREALLAACEDIAPTWPLDQLIAVNPWWELRDQPFAEACARLAALARVRPLMPRSWFATAEVSASALRQEARAAGREEDPAALRAALDDQLAMSHWHNISDLLDSGRDRQHKMAWRDEITQQISQFCGSEFQRQAPPAAGDLYRAWLRVTRLDRGIAILMDESRLPKQFMALPEAPEAVFDAAIDELELAPEGAEYYGHALLLDINGWASWAAWLRWQATLAGESQSLLPDLLAIRLAWELVLWRHQAATDPAAFEQTRSLWRLQQHQGAQLLALHRKAQALPQLWQRALERDYQQDLAQRLGARPAADDAPPVLQAVFCIDVRSEVIRRHLEAQHPGIHTLGCAGFFGLPIAYRPTGTDFSRPQLPGLLAPAIEVTGSADAGSCAAAHNRRARIAELGDAPPAMFGVVEALGLVRLGALLRETLRPRPHAPPVAGPPAEVDWQLSRNGSALSVAEQAELAAGVLRTMGLTRDFAPTVLLVGHGSPTRNNPHAAGLNCGACGGQSGDINARVLAALLNDVEVRRELAAAGIEIADETRFVAALHDTVTDEIHCLDAAAPDDALADWLARAGEAARAERAARFSLSQPEPSLLASAQSRSRDWSQVRPEWGLAGCAAFIIAPRARTRGLDLEGRTFLHDYHWQADSDGSALELLLTAPMVVTHWISMQYYASVTDNLKYGSGNKVLHNVVGGNLGVFEGNGGDLRIGLPLQSVHDGKDWVHEPLRLSVFVAAPRESLAEVVARHDDVRQLVDNEWLYLFRLDDDGHTIERLRHGHWAPLA